MNNPTLWQFADAQHALMWSADVLRQRRMPRSTPLWRQIPSGAEVEAEVNATTPWGDNLTFHLPEDPEERYALALNIEKQLTTIGEIGNLLRLHAWGDWHSEQTLRGAIAIQERARQEGHRIRLNYRYSFRQLGLLLSIDHKTAARKVRDALEYLADHLATTNLIFTPHNPAHEEFINNF